MKIFLDTSSLLKLYHKEEDTVELESLFSETKITSTSLSLSKQADLFFAADKLLKLFLEMEGLTEYSRDTGKKK